MTISELQSPSAFSRPDASLPALMLQKLVTIDVIEVRRFVCSCRNPQRVCPASFMTSWAWRPVSPPLPTLRLDVDNPCRDGHFLIEERRAGRRRNWMPGAALK